MIAALIIPLAVTLIIVYLFIVFAFRIKRQLWNQQQTINLLIQIAKKLGASGEEIDLIERKNNGASDQYL